MTLAPEGRSIILGVTLLAAVLLALGWWLGGVWLWLLGLVAAASLGFTLWFFRDPSRTVPTEAADGTVMLAPADGKVIEIVEEDEPLYLKAPGRRLSIFLSPLNVHVNRIPVTGVVEYENYFAGEYLVAWHPKASTLNERSEVGMRHASGVPVLFKQIAGAVARRIVYYAKVGDRYNAGDRYGIVKFGSRMDIIVPPEIRFTVEIGQMVTAGETPIARLPAAPAAEAAA